MPHYRGQPSALIASLCSPGNSPADDRVWIGLRAPSFERVRDCDPLIICPKSLEEMWLGYNAVYDLHAEVVPICNDLGAALHRFGGYGARLSHALDRVRGGDTDWFTKPMIDSYHTVWFELHEDLLVTLGIDRHKEGGA